MRKNLIGILAAAIIGLAAVPAPAGTGIAVFNFQMKSATPDWKWLEKGLADRIATDFVQDSGLSLVARDEMQLVAQKINWVPEMAVQEGRLAEIRQTLKFEYLVTGVFKVADGTLTLTGQVVEVNSRNEVARKEVTGKVENVLDLQRQLSAELLAWFSKKKPDAILEQLPVWTQSLPAARALYEGMDLYDQGRYAEGWLKFRQASRQDPQYAEAEYWVGKMYYFMNRYDHAQRALEKFVYMDTVHPRLGDALIEYVHMYEARGADPKTLLTLYDRIARRLPEAHFLREDDLQGKPPLTAEEWTLIHTLRLYMATGQPLEVLKRATPEPPPSLSKNPIEMIEQLGFMSGHLDTAPFATLAMELLMAQSGQTVDQKPFVSSDAKILQFGGDGETRTLKAAKTIRLLGPKSPIRKTDKWASGDRDSFVDFFRAMAPQGYVFKSLQFQIVTEGAGAADDVWLRLPAWQRHVNPDRIVPAAATGTTVILEKTLPRTGILDVNFRVAVAKEDGGPVFFKECRVTPTFEKIGPSGTLQVECENAGAIRVEIDGVTSRWYSGLIGPLAAGVHAVKVAPLRDESPFDSWTGKVTVQVGKTATVTARLPWKKESVWAGWRSVTVPPDYAPPLTRFGGPMGPPAIQMDEEAIRMVWSCGGNLWSAVSTDGQTFSQPVRMDLPVSSAWRETRPQLVRDETGRFVLVVTSNRDARHLDYSYMAWSRDFIHWSAPAVIEANRKPVGGVFLMRDSRGRLVVMTQYGDVLTTRDSHVWQAAARPTPSSENLFVRALAILQRDDGQYEAIHSFENRKTRDGKLLTDYPLQRSLSGDLSTWKPGPPILPEPLNSLLEFSLAAGHSGGLSFLFCYNRDRLTVLQEKADGTWTKSPDMWGVASRDLATAYHPKWGYALAWTEHVKEGRPDAPSIERGPFLLLGPGLEALLATNPKAPGATAPEK